MTAVPEPDKKHKKPLRYNIGAIITAIIVLLLIGNYVFRVIPANQKKQDAYNKNRLDQFSEQFNFTLKDYVNAIEIDDIKNAMRPVLIDFVKDEGSKIHCQCETDSSITNTATRFKKAFYDTGFKKNIALSKNTGICQEDSLFINLAQKLKQEFIKIELNKFKRKNKMVKTDSIFANSIVFSSDKTLDEILLDIIIVQKINIQTIQNEQDELILKGKIFLNFNCSPQTCTAQFTEKLRELSFTKSIKKQSLKARLSGGSLFDHWIIYNVNEKDMEVLVNNGIDFQERDSLKLTSSKRGVITYPFSDKRFYKLSFNVEGTNHYILLIGAVNQENFESTIHTTDVSATIAAIIAVILIFLCIPLIKPLISSAKENLTQRDLLNATSALGIFAVIIACFVLTTALSNIQKTGIKVRLKENSNEIERNFSGELLRYENYLPFIKDSLKINTSVHSKLPGLISVSDIPAIQNFFIMAPSGEIIKDITNAEIKVRKNFSDRDYFRILHDPDKKYKTVYTAVYSKNDNKYKFVYATNHGDSVHGFAYKPKNTSSPVEIDEGYIICRKDGQVINHSDSSRNLNENFFHNYENDPDVQKIFHGFGENIFPLKYDNADCLFYGRQFKYKGDTPYPLYIFSYKKINFEDNLKIYSLVNGFIFSSSYAISLIILAFLYSTLFYLGNIRVFSRYHFYWLFPDNSRKREYKVLTGANLIMVIAFIICVFTNVTNIFYNSLIAGFNLLFVNFVFLNLREFLPIHIFDPLVAWFDKIFNSNKEDQEEEKIKGESKNVKTVEDENPSKSAQNMLQFSMVAIIPFGLSLISGSLGYYSLGFFLMLGSHFIYLRRLGKKCEKITLKLDTINKPFKKKIFTLFMGSNVLFHYWTVPCIIVFCLFSSENFKYNQFHRSSLATTSEKTMPQGYLSQEPTLRDILYDLHGGVNPPSWQPLRDSKFDHYPSNDKFIDTLSEFISGSWNNYLFLMVLFGAFLITACILFILAELIRFYTARFFFIDLSTSYQDKKLLKQENDFLNDNVILPPYNSIDLLNLENNEKISADRKVDFSESEVYQTGTKALSNIEKIELITIQNIKSYQEKYIEIWRDLSNDEKFVLKDFAEDFFVNYKNKRFLVSLIEKGLIIADPLTGRLRLMNYTFRVFVLKYISANPEMMPESDKDEGTYSRWKVPLFIIAFSGLLFLLYINRSGFDEILLISGTVISTLGVIIKLFEAYKKQTV